MLARTQNAQSFYYYDTVAASGSDNKDRTFRVDNPEEHRRLLASLLKRSQFYITNRSFVNRPEFLDGREEISARFYEGAASGAIMIGEAPRCAHFREQFDWPDSVIEMPFDSPEIGKFLDDLKRTPDRLMAARSANVMHAARRHDWVYRIQDMFDAIGLPHTEQMHMRVEQLEDIAASVSAQSRDFKRDSVTHASLMVAARND